jgi:hypothetical protein
MNEAFTASLSIDISAAYVVPPLEVTRSRSTAGESCDCCAKAVAPANVASARRRPWSTDSPISPAAWIIASMK